MLFGRSRRGPVCYINDDEPYAYGGLARTQMEPPVPAGPSLLPPQPGAIVLTSAQLESVVDADNVSPALTEAINRGLEEGEVTSLIGAAMFIAQAAHESDGFKSFYEGGGKIVYNSKTNSTTKFKDYNKQKEKNPDDKVYDYFEYMYDPESPNADRKKVAKNLGNTNKGDGVRYRGRGIFQLTGRANYRAAGKALKLDLEANPDLAADPLVAGQIAGWFWKTKRLNRFTGADTEANFKAITLRINGGYNGQEDRERRYETAKEALLSNDAGPGLTLP